MTMFTLPNFCRVCLKYDKNLIDLAHIENEPNETLMSKLQHCVSEVEWDVFKPLLCHPCIKRLNVAHNFKKQCVQSASVLKNYIELVKESQKKTDNLTAVKCENVPQGGAYMLLPNQKYVKILVGSQNQGNTFQNVFLNLIPTTTLNTLPTPESANANTNVSKNTKDTNQNVFLNINSTFQKFVPIAPSDIAKKPEKNLTVNVNQLLTETKTEELSVELDPTDFTGLEDEDEEQQSPNQDSRNDWDDVITLSKIKSKDKEASINGDSCSNGNSPKSNPYGNYVSILPKQSEDFFNSGQHFLSSSFENSGEFVCETCQKSFNTVRQLKIHIKQFHLGKLPFKCEYCYNEFALRTDYDMCVTSHKHQADSNKSLTLEDFADTSLNSENNSVTELNTSSAENGEFSCNDCGRMFNSSTGLLRHKVRKHNQKTKKKYFIKGMKNAKCDICNREFSTQSYMQLHRKLHLRDDIGYKYKVFGKSKYGDKGKNKKDAKDEDSENMSTDEVKKSTEKASENVEINIKTETSKDEDEHDEKNEEQDVKMDVDDDDNSEDDENNDTDEMTSEEN